MKRCQESDPATGAWENTLRPLAQFLCLDHPTKSDVASGKKTNLVPRVLSLSLESTLVTAGHVSARF